MIEPEIQNYLSGINQTLTEIKNKKGPGIWRSFFNGMFSAFGYFIALTLIIAIVGFIVQKTGLLKDFQNQVNEFQELMRQAKSFIGTGDSQQSFNKQGEVITLPNGQQVKVVPMN